MMATPEPRRRCCWALLLLLLAGPLELCWGNAVVCFPDQSPADCLASRRQQLTVLPRQGPHMTKNVCSLSCTELYRGSEGSLKKKQTEDEAKVVAAVRGHT